MKPFVAVSAGLGSVCFTLNAVLLLLDIYGKPLDCDTNRRSSSSLMAVGSQEETGDLQSAHSTGCAKGLLIPLTKNRTDVIEVLARLNASANGTQRAVEGESENVNVLTNKDRDGRQVRSGGGWNDTIVPPVTASDTPIIAGTDPFTKATVPKPDSIKFTDVLQDDVYAHLTPKDVRSSADRRFSLLDNFEVPNKRLCSDAEQEEEWIAQARGGSYHGLVLMWIHTATENYNRRAIARQLWASRSVYRLLGAPIVPVFAVGQSPHKAMRIVTEQESTTHNDMVVLRHRDVYHNVTYKAVGGMRWVTKYCPQATVLLKVDDDTMVVPTHLVSWLRTSGIVRGNLPLSIHARYAFRHLTKKNGTDRWRLDDKEWPPKYITELGAPGLAYLLSTDLLPYMYVAIRAVPWIWLEDVWITGTLPEALIAAGVPVNRVDLTSDRVVHQSSDLTRNISRGLSRIHPCFIGQMPTSRLFNEKVYRVATEGSDG